VHREGGIERADKRNTRKEREGERE